MTEENIRKITSPILHEPILEYYRGYYSACFLILRPFHKNVFHENYEYEVKLQDTYHLLETVSWKTILKETKIKNHLKLALATAQRINGTPSRFAVGKDVYELASYYNRANVSSPIFENDDIPVEITVPFLQFIINAGYTSVISCRYNIFTPERDIAEHPLSANNIFTIASKISREGFIASPDFKYCLFVPYPDTFHILLLANTGDIEKAIRFMDVEGFYADKNTTNDNPFSTTSFFSKRL